MKKRYYFSLIVIFILIVFDQLTKLLIVKNYSLNGSVIIIKNFLKFYYINNYGASFGIFGGKTIFIVFLTLLILLYLLKSIQKDKNNRLLLFSSILIFGGAIGNLIDRVFRGYVIDFISFTLFNNEMPIFNLADIYITFGVILYLYMLFMEGKNERNSNRRRK